MRTFFRQLFSNPAWDSKGKSVYLLNRRSSAEACSVVGVPAKVIDRALCMFCDAFDIPEEQRFCLRPSDRICDIYGAMVTGNHDDWECERLMMNVKELIKRQLSQEECGSIVSIEDLIRLLRKNTVA